MVTPTAPRLAGKQAPRQGPGPPSPSYACCMHLLAIPVDRSITCVVVPLLRRDEIEIDMCGGGTCRGVRRRSPIGRMR